MALQFFGGIANAIINPFGSTVSHVGDNLENSMRHATSTVSRVGDNLENSITHATDQVKESVIALGQNLENSTWQLRESLLGVAGSLQLSIDQASLRVENSVGHLAKNVAMATHELSESIENSAQVFSDKMEKTGFFISRALETSTWNVSFAGILIAGFLLIAVGLCVKLDWNKMLSLMMYVILTASLFQQASSQRSLTYGEVHRSAVQVDGSRPTVVQADGGIDLQQVVGKLMTAATHFIAQATHNIELFHKSHPQVSMFFVVIVAIYLLYCFRRYRVMQCHRSLVKATGFCPRLVSRIELLCWLSHTSFSTKTDLRLKRLEFCDRVQRHR